MTKILVVEDDTAILRGLTHSLEYEGYEVVAATDGEAAYTTLRAQRPDFIVLDVILPKLSGFDLCRRLRTEGVQTPVLMLTAKSQESDRVEGFDIGADDYVTKPFSVRELMGRIRAILRRVESRPNFPARLTFGDLDVDFERFEVRRNGTAIEITRKEFAILRFLIQSDGQVVSREELLDEVWGGDFYPESRTVDRHVATLRAKIERDPAAPVHLQTVYGVGYKFVPEAKS